MLITKNEKTQIIKVEEFGIVPKRVLYLVVVVVNVKQNADASAELDTPADVEDNKLYYNRYKNKNLYLYIKTCHQLKEYKKS